MPADDIYKFERSRLLCTTTVVSVTAMGIQQVTALSRNATPSQTMTCLAESVPAAQLSIVLHCKAVNSRH